MRKINITLDKSILIDGLVFDETDDISVIDMADLNTGQRIATINPGWAVVVGDTKFAFAAMSSGVPMIVISHAPTTPEEES